MAEEIRKQNFGIVVDDGSVTVPICNKQGEKIGEFAFRPTDIGIVDRFNDLAAEFDKIVDPLESVNIKPDGTTDERNDAEFTALREAEARLYAACDKLFGGNMSEAIFGKVLLRERSGSGRCLYLSAVRRRGKEDQQPS